MSVPERDSAVEEGGSYKPRPVPRASLIVRSILWVAISLAFLVWNLRRIVQMRALGLPLRWWAYVQVVLWLIALCFWVWAGWRDFRRREARRG